MPKQFLLFKEHVTVKTKIKAATEVSYLSFYYDFSY